MGGGSRFTPVRAAGLGLLAGEAVLEGGYAVRQARHELADAAGINRDGDNERHGLLLHRDDGADLARLILAGQQKS